MSDQLNPGPLPPTRLRLLRLARGLSQEELARLAGTGLIYTATCERGMVSESTLAKLGKFFGVEPYSLLDRIADLEERVTSEVGR